MQFDGGEPDELIEDVYELGLVIAAVARAALFLRITVDEPC